MLDHKNVFIEKRKLTPIEFIMVLILEDMACHGLYDEFFGYSIDLVNLGKRGIFRVLKHDGDSVLVSRRYPPRIRQAKRKKR